MTEQRQPEPILRNALEGSTSSNPSSQSLKLVRADSSQLLTVPPEKSIRATSSEKKLDKMQQRKLAKASRQMLKALKETGVRTMSNIQEKDISNSILEMLDQKEGEEEEKS